jgi:hypothetical protein
LGNPCEAGADGNLVYLWKVVRRNSYPESLYCFECLSVWHWIQDNNKVVTTKTKKQVVFPETLFHFFGNISKTSSPCKWP